MAKQPKVEMCKNCNNPLPPKAKVCPACGAKVKKPIYKKWWFWLIVAVLLISVVSGSDSNETTDAEPVVAETPVEDETLEIEIIAGELGEYGQDLVLNENTDMPDATIGYFVPAGTYEITNIGDYKSQANVYKNERHVTEDGWEEWADAEVTVVDVGASVEMTIEEGYFFNCDEPAHFMLKKIG